MRYGTVESSSSSTCSANGYQAEESEQWIGEWLAKTGHRDEMVIATKYTTGYKRHVPELMQSNTGGTGSKSMHVSVRESLKKLQTDYIDLVSGRTSCRCCGYGELKH